MPNLKEKILQSARELFEEKGYSGVSLRMIAHRAGTSIGNLTYHYPQKEDLILAIQRDLRGQLAAQIPRAPEDCAQLVSYLIDVSEALLRAQNGNRYYFANILSMSLELEVIRRNALSVREILFEIYSGGLSRLARGGYLRRSVSREEREGAACAIVLLITYWVIDRSLFSDGRPPCRDLALTVRGILVPLLSRKGLRALRGRPEPARPTASLSF